MHALLDSKVGIFLKPTGWCSWQDFSSHCHCAPGCACQRGTLPCHTWVPPSSAGWWHGHPAPWWPSPAHPGSEFRWSHTAKMEIKKGLGLHIAHPAETGSEIILTLPSERWYTGTTFKLQKLSEKQPLILFLHCWGKTRVRHAYPGMLAPRTCITVSLHYSVMFRKHPLLDHKKVPEHI